MKLSWPDLILPPINLWSLPMTTTEHDHQVNLMSWAAMQTKALPELNLLFAIPNGGHRHPATGAKLKAEGVKAGVPDIALMVAKKGYHGLFIELKTEKKSSKLSDVQINWLNALTEQGYKAVECRGWNDARNTILDYLN